MKGYLALADFRLATESAAAAPVADDFCMHSGKLVAVDGPRRLNRRGAISKARH
jgi:hypothetical protein